ncbi:MAG: PQQ-binding-like beta-propeller repeat protein, partial [Actinobacteria bacterium]|nr:PQQ-binding-like beta-propeller repeat protein [Actinomycetota bacterium]
MRKLFMLLAASALLSATVVGLASASRSGKNVTPSAETANAYLMAGDKPCTNDWMNYGCDQGDTSYSQLTQINAGNLSKLHVIWDQGYSTSSYTGTIEGQPLCCANGMMYLASANTDEAVDPATGNIIWQYQGAKYDTTSGGAAATNLQIPARNIGYDPIDNEIFAGQQDSSLVALNAKTGSPLWTAQVAGAGLGTYGTSTKSESEPVSSFINTGKQRLVLSAPNGGESPMRGQLSAFDARSGKLVWRNFTTPDPTQTPF